MTIHQRLQGPPAAVGRILALDGVRGLAILLVLGVHYGPPALGFGWLGVDLFFVLSGFLITGILLRSAPSWGTLRAFYLRRMLRLAPIYYLVLAITLVAGGLVGRTLWYALYVANWDIVLHGWPDDPIRVAWSLAVEEQFYLLWPAIVMLAPRRALPGVCAALITAAPLFRLWRIAEGDPVSAYVLLPSRMDGLAWGGLLAIAATRMPLSRLHRPALWSGALTGSLLIACLLSVGLAYGHPLTQVAGYSLAAVLFASVLVLASGPLARPFELRLLRWFGQHSYALYLVHMPVLAIFGSPLLALPAAMLLAWLSGRYFEGPILRLKRAVPYAEGTNGPMSLGWPSWVSGIVSGLTPTTASVSAPCDLCRGPRQSVAALAPEAVRWCNSASGRLHEVAALWESETTAQPGLLDRDWRRGGRPGLTTERPTPYRPGPREPPNDRTNAHAAADNL